MVTKEEFNNAIKETLTQHNMPKKSVGELDLSHLDKLQFGILTKCGHDKALEHQDQRRNSS